MNGHSEREQLPASAPWEEDGRHFIYIGCGAEGEREGRGRDKGREGPENMRWQLGSGDRGDPLF
jgi:hypothetical protein